MEKSTKGFHDQQHTDGCEDEDNDTHYKNKYIVVPATIKKQLGS